MRFIAQQFGSFGPQLQDFSNDRVVIMFVAVIASVVIGSPDLLSQLTIVGIGEERIHRGTSVGDCPLPRMFACLVSLFGSTCHGADDTVRAVQPNQLHLRSR